MEAVETGSGPGPEGVVDLQGFIDALIRLRAQAGSPPFRALAKRVGPLLSPAREVPFRTVADVFQPGRRRLDLDLVVAIVRALGADAQQVAAWRRACLRVHAEAKTGGPVGVFRQLPADLSTFTGREDHLQQLIDTAGRTDADAPTTVVISAIEGMAGIGKTQLAVHAAHELLRAGRYGDVQLFVNLRGFDPEQPPADPAAVLDAFLRALEVPAQHIPESVDERAAMFRDRLHGKNTMILLDNAANEQQVRDLIPAHPGSLVLITSRRALAGLDGTTTHELDVFTTDEALQLLGRIVGAERVAAESGHAAQLIRQCGHLPLALALTASYVRSRPAWSLADVVDRLATGGPATLGAGDRRLGQVFDLSYRSLSPDLQRVYRLLSLHPGVDFTADSAAALCALDPDDTRAALDTLVDEHLLQTKSGRRFEYHDLLRAFAAECASTESTREARQAAVGQLLDWYIHAAAAAVDQLVPGTMRYGLDLILPPPSVPVFADHAAAMQWLLAERLNLAAAVARAQDHHPGPQAWVLAAQIYHFHNHRGLWSDMWSTHTIGLRAAARIGDPVGRARMFSGLYFALKRLERLDESLDAARQAVEAAEEAGDAKLTAAAVTNYAAALDAIGSRDEALVWHQRSVTAMREIGNPATLAGALLNLGITFRDTGRYAEAAERFREALEFAREADAPFIEAYVRHESAVSWLDQGALDEAIVAFGEAADLRARIGDQAGQAESLEHLGDARLRVGEPEEARDAWKRSLALLQELGDATAAHVQAKLGDGTPTGA